MVGPEAVVEKYLKESVEAAGGMCIKIKSSGIRGVPDRIVVLNWLTMFVELKSEKGQLSGHQERTFGDIDKVGGLVFVLSTKEQIDNFIRFVMMNEPPSNPEIEQILSDLTVGRLDS